MWGEWDEDVGDATFLNEDKAIIMMRYIRKAIDDGTFVKSVWTQVQLLLKSQYW